MFNVYFCVNKVCMVLAEMKLFLFYRPRDGLIARVGFFFFFGPPKHPGILLVHLLRSRAYL